jgi:arsenite methyltransferase
MLAARRLPNGRAVGADVWRRRDQSGNSRAAARRNAEAEGVGDRVDLLDADARGLGRRTSFGIPGHQLTLVTGLKPHAQSGSEKEDRNSPQR